MRFFILNANSPMIAFCSEVIKMIQSGAMSIKCLVENNLKPTKTRQNTYFFTERRVVPPDLGIWNALYRPPLRSLSEFTIL